MKKASTIAGLITGNNAADLIERLARELAAADGGNVRVTLDTFDRDGRTDFINVYIGSRLASTINVVKVEQS